MASNRGVVYVGPGKVEVRPIDFPKLSLGSRKCEHGVILKVVSTNICGSDQHMVRGRTTAPAGMVLGHEITGEIIEKGRDVEFLNVGDLVSVPFNIACGRCRNCREGKTGICLNVNGDRAGGAFGYVDMGGWVGGQADYVMAPYADFNLLKFPDKDQALEKIEDLTLLSDISTNLKLSDMETCYKVFRREVLEGIQIRSDRFGFEPEITAKIAKGHWRIYEVPISYAGRTYEEGKKITWKDGFQALWCIIRFRFPD